MALLRYVGNVEKTLIDVAALTNGKVFEIDDARAERLVNAFPGEYEKVDEAVAAKKSKAAPSPEESITSPEDTTGETVTQSVTDESTST